MISFLHVLYPQCDLPLCFSSHSQSKPNPKVVVCCAPGVFESRVVRYKPWSLPTTSPLSVSTHILCLQDSLMGKNDSFNLFESFLLVSDGDIVFRKKGVTKHRWINYLYYARKTTKKSYNEHHNFIIVFFTFNKWAPRG